MGTASSHGLLHVNLNVSDIERSVRFYSEVLGFQSVTTSSDNVDRGAGPELIRQAVLTVPGSSTILALTQAATLEVGPKGLNHLGLVLASDAECEVILDRIESIGGSIQKHGVRDAGGVSEAFAYIRDPDGYVVEISTQAILYSHFPDRVFMPNIYL